MDEVAWQLEHSVEADVQADFAWSFWTDVTNWDDPPAQFELDGPFAVGSHGTTLIPGQEPRHWTIRDVRPGKLYVIETLVEGAMLSFEWRFERITDRKTRLTQRIVLSGAKAADYIDVVQAGFGPTLAEGMNRIAGLLERAEERARGTG